MLNRGTALDLLVLILKKLSVSSGSSDMREAPRLSSWLSCVFCVIASTKEKYLHRGTERLLLFLLSVERYWL